MTEKEKTVYEKILEKFNQSSRCRFAEIATEQFNKLLEEINNKFSGKMCPDQYIGQITNPDVWKKFFLRTDIFNKNTSDVINIPNAENILILILESPHTDEFDKNGNPVGPANGSTGENIRQYILDIWGGGYKDYHLILMNAIPYQCSLGVETEFFRYTTFKTAWTDKNFMDNKNTGADFFKNRLENLLNTLLGKEVVLVNACTKGYNNPKDSKTKPFLWRFVEKSVESLTLKEKKEIQYFRINHPSSWRRNEKNREIKDNRQLTLKKG